MDTVGEDAGMGVTNAPSSSSSSSSSSTVRKERGKAADSTSAKIAPDNATAIVRDAYTSRSDGLQMEELLKPIGSIEEKHKLLPHFLRMRGLMRQHIDSFNHFIRVEIKNVVAAKSNCEVTSEADPKFFLRYTDIYIGEPSIDEQESFQTSNVTPFQCRLRDCTYSAPLLVNVKYYKERKHVIKKGVNIGRIPIMLRSDHCILSGKSEEELAALKECAYDPGGYFIIKGVEKAMNLYFSHYCLLNRFSLQCIYPLHK